LRSHIGYWSSPMKSINYDLREHFGRRNYLQRDGRINWKLKKMFAHES
jgi:hypothetical protein